PDRRGPAAAPGSQPGRPGPRGGHRRRLHRRPGRHRQDLARRSGETAIATPAPTQRPAGARLAGPNRAVKGRSSLIPPSPGHAAAGPGAPLEHRRAGSTVQDVDLGGSPYLPHRLAEQGTDLLRVEEHAPGGITAAYAGLDDALVVAEPTHRAPPSPFTC